METRECGLPECSNTFTTSHPRKLYCCEKHAQIAYRRAHPEQVKASKRKSREKAKAKREADRVAKGTPPVRRGPKPKGDSQQQKKKAAARRRAIKANALNMPPEGLEKPFGSYISYGRQAAAAYLEQQAREMEERKARFYASLKGGNGRETAGTE